MGCLHIFIGDDVACRAQGRGFPGSAGDARGQNDVKVFEFYQEALAGYQDIKFRDWKDYTYIEDDGNLSWHSITISKQDTGGATIVIVKDNWTWIIGTLVLRYIGVFVVLLLLLIGMSISGAIISRFFKEDAQPSA